MRILSIVIVKETSGITKTGCAVVLSLKYGSDTAGPIGKGYRN
jgi:hypothetical protein